MEAYCRTTTLKEMKVLVFVLGNRIEFLTELKEGYIQSEFRCKINMTTYKKIQEYVNRKYGFIPETCWIAHAKSRCGIPVKPASNRINPKRRVKPCPEDKFLAIKDALEHFKLI